MDNISTYEQEIEKMKSLVSKPDETSGNDVLSTKLSAHIPKGNFKCISAVNFQEYNILASKHILEII